MTKDQEKKFQALSKQLQVEASRALRSLDELMKLSFPTEEQRRKGFQSDDQLRYIFLYAFINHAGLVAAILFSKRYSYRDREVQDELKKAYGITEDSPLQNRDIRNASQHIDERLEKWAADSDWESPFHENIGGNISWSQNMDHQVFLYWDMSGRIYHRKQEYSDDSWVAKYEISEIKNELIKISDGGDVRF